MTLKDALSQVARFDTLAMAHGFANRSNIGQRIVRGNGGPYIVCSHRVAAVLLNNGYQAIY